MKTVDLLEPSKAYNSFLKDEHKQNVEKYFDELTKQSGVNVEANREICSRLYKQKNKVDELAKKVKKAKTKKAWLTVLFVISIIAVIAGIVVGVLALVNKGKSVVPIIVGFVVAGIFIMLIPVAIVQRKKAKLQISDTEKFLSKEQKKLEEVTKEATDSMMPLNALFTEGIAPKLFEKTTELIKMDPVFNQERMQHMIDDYGYSRDGDEDSSTLAVQSGTILGNPFAFVRSYNMHIVDHIYTGTLLITWTTTSRDSNGHTTTVTHTQTLHASLVKPRPEYYEETRLIYANKAAERLSFSRSPSDLSKKSKQDIQKYVSKHEGELAKLAEKSLKKGKSYTPLGNSEFEFVFGGLDRDNEIEYRLLFTPLAQKSMLDLLETPEPYGDDFKLIKNKCINTVISSHDQNLSLFESPSYFMGFDYDKMKDNFINYNNEYFKAVFYDFAPLLSIPLYQQNKAREYIYKYNHQGNFSSHEHEALANLLNVKSFVHEKTKTPAILKTELIGDKDGFDTVEVTANSFDEIPQVTFIPVLGGDGKMHPVPVHWFRYDALSKQTPMVLTSIGGNLNKYRSLGKNYSSSGDVAYSKGLFSYIPNESTSNIDIKSLKDIMSK